METASNGNEMLTPEMIEFGIKDPHELSYEDRVAYSDDYATYRSGTRKTDRG